MLQSFSLLISILLTTVAVALLLAVLFYFDLQIPLINLFYWLQQLGWWAPLLFVVVDMLLVILLIPSVLFTLAAGFMFGVLVGGASVVIATTLGAIGAFIISRYLFSSRVKDYLRNHKKMKVVSEELVHEGWKLILLCRLVPFFPFKLSNYIFGLSDFSLRHFIIGTSIGVIPNTFVIVYLGSLASDLRDLATGEILRSQFAWSFYAVGSVLLVITLTYITRHAQLALERYEARTQKGLQ